MSGLLFGFFLAAAVLLRMLALSERGNGDYTRPTAPTKERR